MSELPALPENAEQATFAVIQSGKTVEEILRLYFQRARFHIMDPDVRIQEINRLLDWMHSNGHLLSELTGVKKTTIISGQVYKSIVLKTENCTLAILSYRFRYHSEVVRILGETDD